MTDSTVGYTSEHRDEHQPKDSCGRPGVQEMLFDREEGSTILHVEGQGEVLAGLHGLGSDSHVPQQQLRVSFSCSRTTRPLSVSSGPSQTALNHATLPSRWLTQTDGAMRSCRLGKRKSMDKKMTENAAG